MIHHIFEFLKIIFALATAASIFYYVLCMWSHCVRDYPEYEILFGVSEADDPALEFVKRLKQEFPQHAIRMMVCEQKLGANIKASNLAQMAREARYGVFVVSDS